MNKKVIAHVDMDAFFAAVEQRDDPRLRNKPVVIGADPKKGKGRGVVSTCSYEARRFGVHSAMPISIAYRRCPQAVFLPVNGKKYQQVSDQIFEILSRFTPQVEPISIDEAFLDITGTSHLHQTPYRTCFKIKEKIKEEVRLTASIGIAPIKMAAKMASDCSKPDGLLEISSDRLFDFLWPQPVERLWGVGPKNKIVFDRLGLKTIGDIAHSSQEIIFKQFGEAGIHLYNLAHGVDPREVVLDELVKSISHEYTFDQDTGDLEVIHAILLFLSQKVSRRLRKSDLKGRTLTLKIRLTGFKTYSRTVTLEQRTNFTDTIYQNAEELFKGFWQEGMSLRLIGVRISNLDDLYVQDSLFKSPRDGKKESVHTALDQIKDRFGEHSIHWGTGP